MAEGNLLTAATSSNAAGITVEVSSTTGGNITISDGVVDQLDTLLATFLATDNAIDTRISRLQENADDIVDDREF